MNAEKYNVKAGDIIVFLSRKDYAIKALDLVLKTPEEDDNNYRLTCIYYDSEESDALERITISNEGEIFHSHYMPIKDYLDIYRSKLKRQHSDEI